MKHLILLFIFLLGGIFYVQPVHANESTRKELVQLAVKVHREDLRKQALLERHNRVQRVKEYLEVNSSPLKNNAAEFVDCSEQYGFNPGLLVGIVRAESTLGKYYALPNNPFNYGVHLGLSFSSIHEAVCHVARHLRNEYDTSSILAIGRRYAPSSDGNNPVHWASVVGETIREVGI